MGADEEIKKVAEFLPECAKQQVFGLLLEHYAGEKQLAGALGLDSSLVRAWQGSQKISREHFPGMLALAVKECPQAKGIIKGALDEFSFLCQRLGVAETCGQGEKAGIFMGELDNESKAIVLHLLRTGHAKISELSSACGLNDSVALCRIKELINPAAERILGKPILTFRETAFDSGKKAWFSWWIDEGMRLPDGREPQIVEVGSEKNFLMITAEAPGISEEDISVSVGDGCVSISAKNNKGGFFKKIPLHCPVKRVCEKRLNNGILEIRLEKGGENNGICQLSKEADWNRKGQKSA